MTDRGRDPRASFRLIRTGPAYLFRLLRANPGRTLRAIANTLVGRHRLSVAGREIAGSPLEIAEVLYSLEPAMAAIRRAVAGRPVRTIVDAGAHLGVFSVLAAAEFPTARIVALEPNPATAAVCRSNLAGLPGVEFRQVALAATGGPVRLFAAADRHDQGATLRPEFRRPDQTVEHVVPAVAVSEILAEFPAIEVLKLDIEGAEHDLLGDLIAAADRIGVLFLELHDDEGTVGRTADDMAELAGAFEPARVDRYTHGRGKYYSMMAGRSRRFGGPAGDRAGR